MSTRKDIPAHVVENIPSPSYIFTQEQDWFTHNIITWEPLIVSLRSTLPSGRAPRALEIGSWEGRSAAYILTTLCASHDSLLVCIDHFDLFRTEAGKERYTRVLHNLELTRFPFRLIDEFSVPGLMTLLREEVVTPSQSAGFDFVYIDGSHEADDTFLDAELAWRLTRQGALFILDDYGWDKEPPTSIHHPARGIDAFLTLHAGQFELLFKDYQIILRKTAEMRIGFLTKSPLAEVKDDILEGLGYGINVALCANVAYAMPTAVAIRSTVEATLGRRLSFYIIDCGMQEEDRRRIADSVPWSRREDVTIVFRTLPKGSRGIHDPTWAKVDMLSVSSVLPVERVLFLDADVLVRHDIAALWATDLGGKQLAATRDIGHPLGHEGLPESERGRPYFNAGVMLLDLTRIRAGLSAFLQMERDRPETMYKDQDFLNAFFVPETWLELDIGWNAGGLGTYATRPSNDRNTVWTHGELMALHQDPYIVHFTGPVHPTMSMILNDYVQPWTSKPWGYAGAPGHPFRGEWWDVLERTEWAGLRHEGAFLMECATAQTSAKESGTEEFERRIKNVF